MDLHILESAGFTKGEVRVYHALLELGETATGKIIKKSGITGSKVYEILNKLAEKGLVAHVIKGKVKHFQVAPPARLLDYIKAKEADIKQQKNEIESLIPSLEAIQETNQMPQSAQIFQGMEGIKTVLSFILDSHKKGEEYCAFTLGKEFKKQDKLVTFFKNYHQKRIERKIKVKIIATSTEREVFEYFAKLEGLKIKYLPDPVPLGVFIFKDNIATFTFKEKPTCFLIKSRQVAESYQEFFNILWEKAE